MLHPSVLSLQPNKKLSVGNSLNDIEKVAWTIWHYLKTNNEATVPELAREISETEWTTSMGIGWLAREGKLDFEKRGRCTYIMLKTPDSTVGASTAQD